MLMLLCMLAVLVIFFCSLILQTHREYSNFKARENRIELKLIQARKEFDQKEAYLNRLLEDPEFLERVARERLGYSRPGELLFRFDDGP
jgi:cell division protein DivIC